MVGTNAIGTALGEETDVQLYSAEHFESTQHPWYCSAVPVHDPHTGALLGIVDISGPAMTLHPAVQLLARTAVRLAEARLMIAQRDQLNSLRDRMSAILAGTPGPALVVERIIGGWLLRPTGERRASVILRTSAGLPVLDIDSGADPIVAPLTPRRGQILAAVTSAGPIGNTAAEFSRQLYGDCDHVVTVRAEVSRLRRSIGALLATRPCRWAEGVSARVE